MLRYSALVVCRHARREDITQIAALHAALAAERGALAAERAARLNLEAEMADQKAYAARLAGVVFSCIPSRAGAHAERLLTGFDGVLQVDGYAGYKRLTKSDRERGRPLALAQCWSHARRKLIDATPKAGSPVAEEALQRTAALYAIEAESRGPDERRAARQARAKPLVDALGAWLRAQKERLSGSSKMGEAVRYILRCWEPLGVFLEDGRVEMDSNRVENLIGPHALTRKYGLFAGHDEGAEAWARVASLIETCRVNGVDPYGYMKSVLEAIAAGHPMARIDELLPWAFAKPAANIAPTPNRQGTLF